MNCHRLSSVALCAFSVLSVVHSQTAEKQGLVQGQVLNASTGEPIRRATVVLNRVGSAARGMMSAGPGPGDAAVGAMTDGAGHFSIPAVEPGNYFISAQKTGFVRGANPTRAANRPGGGAGSMLKLSPGQELKGIQLKLMPQAVLTGRVVDEEGEPVQNVQLQLLIQRYSRGRRQMMPVSGGQTNDKGEYRVANLSPGKYILSFAPNRMGTFAVRTADGSPETGYATLYYPGVQDISQATRLDVAAGLELGGLDVRLQKVRVYRVRGRVADANGAPLKNVFVSLMPRGSFGMFSLMRGGSGTRPNDGSFEIANVTPGSYILTAQSMESGQQTSIQHPVDVGEGNVEGIVVTPAKGQTIEGVVMVEGEDRLNLQTTRIMLAPLDAGPMTTSAETPDAEGAFKLLNVLPGKYQVMVFNQAPGTYISSIKLGEREVLGEDVEIGAAAPARLRVTFSSGAGQVNGTVTDRDGPGANATVVLVPQDSRRTQSQFYQTAIADQTGAFSFSSVAPGEYKVFAWEEVEPEAWEDPDFMRPIADQGVTVRVSQRGTETARVKVIPASK